MSKFTLAVLDLPKSNLPKGYVNGERSHTFRQITQEITYIYLHAHIAWLLSPYSFDGYVQAI